MQSQEQTLDLLQRVWYQWGIHLIQRISTVLQLDDDTRLHLERLYLRPNDWQITVEDDS